MPRWFYVALTLVLYTAAMGLVWWALKTWGRPLLGSLYDEAGGVIAWTMLVAALAIASAVTVWLRTPEGRMRSLLPRRE